jgi:hypothetical protein
LGAVVSEHEPARKLPSRPIASIFGRLVMAALFFCVLTPVGFVMRLAGRDRLRLRRDRTVPSYWIERRPAARRPTAMTRQY